MLASNLFGTVTTPEASEQAEEFPDAVPFAIMNTHETSVLVCTACN